MVYKYLLPSVEDPNKPLESETDTNSVIIIGANGSGKSTLGAWIEKRYPANTHRICAQRSLSFREHIPQKTYDQAMGKVIYGHEQERGSHDHKYVSYGYYGSYTSSLQDDFEEVLAALIALQHKEESAYLEECRQLESSGCSHKVVPEMVADKLYRIWNGIFPHRKIKILDGKIITSTTDGQVEYSGHNMSDGERVALYLIVQALCVPKDLNVIVDEPEIHLHRSIITPLWAAIERERQDCLFIYITHDTSFAADHFAADKFWIRSYDGNKWDYEKIEKDELPENLLFDILGNRKHVLFVEGEKSSLDFQIYSNIYPSYYVIPCGSCESVIQYTKAMKANTIMHNLDCYGLIDRDFRTEDELATRREQGVYSAEVAEIENLFLVEEILAAVNTAQGFADKTRIERVKDFIINTKFRHEYSDQAKAAAMHELKHVFSTIDLSKFKDKEIESEIQKKIEQLDFNKIKANLETSYSGLVEEKEYGEILQVYNQKNLSKSIGHYFGLQDKDFCDYVIRHLSLNDESNEFRVALQKYLPIFA